MASQSPQNDAVWLLMKKFDVIQDPKLCILEF